MRPSNSRQSVDGAPVVVTARTLKDAYKIVREEYGEDAQILGTRTVNRRQELGLGHDRQIEVTVQMPGTTPPPRSLGSRRGLAVMNRVLDEAPADASPDAPGDRTKDGTQDRTQIEIVREVERIEELVAAIAEDHARLSRLRLPYCDNPLAETLIENGATPESVNKLLTRFTSETGNDVHNRPAAVAWLTENLRASNCSWDDFYGCHAFLGDTASGRSDMVLTAAALLRSKGRRTLVLSLMPGDNGDVRRLQIEAARNGFDAAVINRESQLEAAEKHLQGYDVVLVDMPHLGHEAMGDGGIVHAWLARNANFHRHLMVPMDKDPRDMEDLARAARNWNCDWIAVSRTDMTRRAAKMLDLLECIPVPVSLTGFDPARTGRLEIAHSDRILDGMLGGGSAASFTEAVAVAAPRETAKVAW